MNKVLSILQILAALLYTASGVMKIFMFDQISSEVASFGALPREVWMMLGIIELICAVGLILPLVLRRHHQLTVIAATILAAESLVFIGVHVRYAEFGSIIMSAALGIVMVFIAYGRATLNYVRATQP